MDRFKFPGEYSDIKVDSYINASILKPLLNHYFDNWLVKAEKDLALYKQYIKNWEDSFKSSSYLRSELDKLTFMIKKQLENFESCEIDKFTVENVTDDYIELCKDNVGNSCMELVHSLFLSQEHTVKNLNKLKKQTWFNPTVTYIWKWDCPKCGSLISYERKDRRKYFSQFKPILCENCGFYTKEPLIIKPYDLDKIIPRLYSDCMKMNWEIPKNKNNDAWDKRSQYKAFELNKGFITDEIFDLVKYLINMPEYVGSKDEILEAIVDKGLDYSLEKLENIGVIKKYQLVKDTKAYAEELFNNIQLRLISTDIYGPNYNLSLECWFSNKVKPSPNYEYELRMIDWRTPELYNDFYYLNDYVINKVN